MGAKEEHFCTNIPGDSWQRQPLAVSARNVCKAYKNGDMVLENFNMNVQVGTIYSLLGSSGCGKTTALSLIVGIISPTNGIVKVFGNADTRMSCSPVGYMPQEISLYIDFTIREIFLYFGRIYGLTESKTAMKIESLSTLLDLPDIDSRISSLSGGQQRRVSLAVALLHDPKLLILDEPTVGVDPLLRERIWEYLHQYVSEQKNTVIITTHYIEETKKSHTIGIMRNGHMLIEETPEMLMERHNTPYLEDIVTQLFKDAKYSRQKGKETYVSSEIVDNNIKAISYRKTETEDCKSVQIVKVSGPPQNTSSRGLKYRKIKALIIRNLLNSVRSPIFFLLCLLFPAINGISLYPIIGVPPKNLNFGVVNPESNFTGSNCLEEFNGCSQFSCAFLHEISSSVLNPIFMQSEEKALASVVRGDTWGYIKFPENYSSSLVNKYTFGNFADNETLSNSEMSFRLDFSNYIVGRILTLTMFEGLETLAAKSLEACGLEEDSRKANLPLNFRKPIYEEKMDSYSSTSAASVLLLTFAIPLARACLLLITDRRNGTMLRNVVAGVSHVDNLSSIMFTEVMIILLQTVVSYIVSYFVLKWNYLGSHFLVAGLLILTGIYGLSLSLLVALVCEEPLQAIMLPVAFVISHVPLTGMLWPLEGSPIWIKYYTNCIPMSWVTDVMRSVLIRGWPLCHPKVYPGIVVIITVTILQFIIAIKLWRKS